MAIQDQANLPVDQFQDAQDVDVSDVAQAPVVKKKKSGLLLLVLILIVGAFLVWLGSLLSNPIKENTEILQPVVSEPTSSIKQTQSFLSDKTINVSSFRVSIPQDWSVSISTQTETVLTARFYSQNANSEISYLEVQVGPSNQFSPNSTIIFGPDATVSEKTSYIKREGAEQLMQSNRKVLQMEKEVDGYTALLTLYGTEQDIAAQRDVVEEIMNNIVSSTQSFKLIQPVFAQAQETTESIFIPTHVDNIVGFSVSEWKPINVMEGPYPERITATDYSYKDGYARLYKFTRLRGQKLEILAEESREDLNHIGSYIEQELYDSSGALIMTGGTRLSLPVLLSKNQTADYYLLVKSFQKKEGRILLRIFDLDQVNDLFSLRYADGSEIQLDGLQQYKTLPAVLIMRLTSPVEVVANNTFRYFRKPDNACIECTLSAFFGDKTVPITVTTAEGEEIPIKITKLFLNQLLIQPESKESFDAGKSYRFTLDFGSDPLGSGLGGGYGGMFRTLE